MRTTKQHTDQFHIILGVLGDVIVAVRGDHLLVRRGRKVVVSREIAGLAEFLSRHTRTLRHDLLPGGNLLLANKRGFGLCQSLYDPAASQWKQT